MARESGKRFSQGSLEDRFCIVLRDACAAAARGQAATDVKPSVTAIR
jgi:hypothetical protein